MVFSVWRKKVSGFTLVEALVVVAIIGILASIGTVSYIGVRSKIRDAKRKNDLNAIAQAFEARKLDKTCSRSEEIGIYPYIMGNVEEFQSLRRWAKVGHLNFLNIVKNKQQCDKPFSFYLSVIPGDPKSYGNSYWSIDADGNAIEGDRDQISPPGGRGMLEKEQRNYISDAIFHPAKATINCWDPGNVRGTPIPGGCYYSVGKSDYLFSNSTDKKHFRLASKLEAYPKGPGIINTTTGGDKEVTCQNEKGYLNTFDCQEYKRNSNDWKNVFDGPPYTEAYSQAAPASERIYYTYFIKR